MNVMEGQNILSNLEKRRRGRYPLDIPISISDAKGSLDMGAIVNLGPRGLCVRGGVTMLPGQTFQFEFHLGERVVRGEGIVRWVSSEAGTPIYGAHISKMDRATTRALHAGLEGLLASLPIDYRLVTSRRDLEQVYRLLYRNYLRNGSCAPHPAGVRITPYDLRKETITFGAYAAGILLASMSITLDGPIGLPIDRLYPEQTAELRHGGRKLAEVRALAHRRSDQHLGFDVFLTLCRMMVRFAVKQGITDSLITVNVRQREIYPRLLKFEALGPQRSFSEAFGQQVVGFRLRMQDREHWSWYNGKPVPEVPDSMPSRNAEDVMYFNRLAARK